jgi:hypothetical protein
VNAVLNLRVPRNAGKLSSGYIIGGLSSSSQFHEVSLLFIKSRKMMRWTGHVARMGEKRDVCRLLVAKPEGRRPLGRPRRRWLDGSCRGGKG